MKYLRGSAPPQSPRRPPAGPAPLSLRRLVLRSPFIFNDAAQRRQCGTWRLLAPPPPPLPSAFIFCAARRHEERGSKRAISRREGGAGGQLFPPGRAIFPVMYREGRRSEGVEGGGLGAGHGFLHIWEGGGKNQDAKREQAMISRRVQEHRQ